MPPEGRRKKKYEQELRRVQNRNFFAALILIAAIAASVFLINRVLIGTKPKVFLSVNRVDYSGTREIPFSDESCAAVSKAFQDNLSCVPGKIQELDEQGSKLLNLDDSISSRDVLVVYLNGHLLTKPGEQEVYWIAPESGSLIPIPFSELLSSVNDSPAKTKIVLLDAGRYTWSPGFPGRPRLPDSPKFPRPELNQFESALVSQLATDQWSKNLWVITSHSDYEISNVSTPLQCSLFAKAVAETLSTLSKDAPDETRIPEELFTNIKKRTQSYSRNFNNKSLQNPVLIRGSVGEIDPTTSPDSLAQNGPSQAEPLRIMWKKKTPADDSEDPAPSTDIPYSLSDFARDSEEFPLWLYSNDHYAALPNQTIRSLERFLEFGESLDWPANDEDRVESYTDKLNQTRDFASESPTDFDRQKLIEKQGRIKQFRNALLELTVLIRLRNQMRFWDDNAYDAVPELPLTLATPIQMDDDVLSEANAPPSSIEAWLRKWEDFRAANEKDLFSKIYSKAQKQQTHSPLQAELLGILTQRYLKLIRSTPIDEEDAKARSVPDEGTISLEPEITGLFNPADQPIESDPGAGYKFVAEKSINETKQFLDSEATLPSSDTSIRFQLAAEGSEFADPLVGRVPNITWTEILREIEIVAVPKSKTVFKVNPYEMIPIQFKLTTTAVEEVDLKIEATGDQLEGLNFGIDSDFKPNDILADLTPINENHHKKEKTVKVYFQYPQFDPTKVDRRFGFLITATDRDNPTVSNKIEFSIKITKEPTYGLTFKRALAKKNDDRQTRLYRWGTKLTGEDWQPLAIRTLANVKSKFDLDLQNNSIVSRSFKIKLFKIKKLPETDFKDSDKRSFRADRSALKQARGFSKWVANQSLKSDEYFELIAEASVDKLAQGAVAPIKFTLPQPDDPKEKKPDPKARVQVEIDQGAFIVFYAAEKPDTPEWFQMVQFQPRDSANVAADNDPLLVQPDIEDVLGAGVKLEDHLAPILADKDNPIAPARLTVVSQNSLAENEHEFEDLKLDELMNGARFSPGTGPALLMLDVLGVSNYATYELNGPAPLKTSLRQRLAGIRVIESPEGWTCNPRSWSFASSPRTVDEFQWLAGDAKETVKVFINTKTNNDQPNAANQDLKLELFLPFKNVDTLSLKQDDYWWRWKGGKKPLLYPNERRHFFEISANGLTAWSTITSHTISLSDPINKVLELIKGEGQNERKLGSWEFVSKSLEAEPSIEANPDNSTNTVPDLKNVRIDVDVTAIQPVVISNQVTINLNKKPVKEIKDFLAAHSNGSGKYRFTLYDLISQFEEPIPEKKTEMEVEVVVVDFFGEQTFRSTWVTVAPKPVPKPPPKPVTFTVNLVMGEDPAAIFIFDEVIINKKVIPLGRVTQLAGDQIKVTGNKQKSTLTIVGLPGLYDLTVTAKVYPPGEAIASSRTTPKTKIKLAEGEPPVTLEFSD